MRKILLPALVLIFAFGFIQLWLAGQYAAAEGVKLAEKQNKSFKYSIYAISPTDAKIQVTAPFNNADDVEKYRAEVAQLSAQYAAGQKDQKIAVTVTFKQPVSLDDFQQLSSRFNIEPTIFAIRTLDSRTNSRGTISGELEPGKGVSREAVERMLNSEQQSENPLVLKGVVDFRANITGDDYNRLSVDANIFLVDALESYLGHEAKGLKSSLNKISYSGPYPYWSIEDYNLFKS